MGSTGRVPCWFNYIIYIFFGQHDTAVQPMTSGQWRPAHVTADHVTSAQWHPSVECHVFLTIYYIYSLAKTTRPFNQWHPAQWQPTTWHPSLECRFYNLLYTHIFMGQNDTAIQPMTSGPVTSIIGVPFLKSIIYIYIHWPKRHECSSSGACQRAAVFF